MMVQPDMFHGVDGGGNCLPGPCRPQGLVKLGPDMVNHNTSGYASNELLKHFSHLHVAGMGGVGRAGNIGIVPIGQRPDARTVGFQITEETAEPGAYMLKCRQQQGFGELANDGEIKAELTATHHCGYHRYRWDASLDPWVRIDLGACIGGVSVGGWCRWLNERTLSGRADYRGGWGHDYQYSVYFQMRFGQAALAKHTRSQNHDYQNDGNGQGAGIQCRVQFEKPLLTVQVGISLVSVAEAARALDQELLERTFDEVMQESKTCWTQKLARFKVSGGTAINRELWATMWTRLNTTLAKLNANDVPWFAAEKTQFTDIVCLWDSCRGANSLLALVEPELQGQLCQALTEISEHTGWLPDAWLSGASGQVQGGTSAAILFAEAVLKKLPGFDAERAWYQLRHHLEEESPDSTKLGIYPQWRTMGYCPTQVPNCASRSVEYAFADHCAAVLSDAVHQTDRASQWRERSAKIWDSWCDDRKCFAPRDVKGDWVDFDPWKPQCRDFWNDPHYYEGTGHDYTLLMWDRMDEVVARFGGADVFEAHLTEYLDRCYLWKEINLHAPWLYHYIGKPHLSTRALRKLADAEVTPGRSGLSDNEDMGAWSSWWLCHAMGLGVVPGSDLYLLGVPRFDSLTLDLPGQDHPLVITTHGGNPETGVVQHAELNGDPLNRAWLRHEEICEGATVKLYLGEESTDWGSDALPPCMAS